VEVKFQEKATFRLRVSNFSFVSAVLSWGPAKGATEFEYRPSDEYIMLDHPAEEVSANIDLMSGLWPPGARVEYSWLLKSADGKQAVTPTERFTLEDSRYTWRTAQSADGRVTVYWHSPNNSLGGSVLERATRSLARVEGLMGHTYARPIVIWVYAEPSELHSAMGLYGRDWVGGVAYHEWGIIMASLPDGSGQQREIALTIPHEISHLVYHQATAGRGWDLQWLNEGLAVINQEESNAASEIVPLREAALDGKLIPLNELNEAFSTGDSDRALLAYAQSRSIVEYMLGRYGRSGVGRIFEEFRLEAQYEASALERGLGLKEADLEREWLAALPYKPAQAVEARSEPRSSNSAQSRSAGQWVTLIPAITCGGMILTIVVLSIVSFVRRRRGYDLAEEEG
jgi:hypothetical protein